jgi:hypothetical protein
VEEAITDWVEKAVQHRWEESGSLTTRLMPGVDGITLHESGQGATVEVSWSPVEFDEIEIDPGVEVTD